MTEAAPPGKMKGGKKKKLPEHLELQRTHMVCGTEINSHNSTFTSANVFMPVGVDNSWDLSEWKSDFEIKINKLDAEVMQVDVIGIDPAIANALRRILIAEVPTVAIEHVFIADNTSIIQDEVLSHRLGLVPIAIDPALMEFKTAEEAPSEKNTVVFKLNVACKRVGDRIMNDKVFSSSLQWLPGGSEMPDETSCRFAQGQSHMYPSGSASKAPAPVHDDILLAKLRPGQSIHLEAHCVKGIGKEHAKWSPVSTAWYKLLPEVVLLKEPAPEVAKQLLEEMPGLFTQDASGRLQVGIAREHEIHLERLRCHLDQPEFAEAVQLRKRKDYFIFTVESTGILPPEVLFQQAIDILHDKAARLAQRL